MKQFLLIILLCLPLAIIAASDEAPIVLEHVKINTQDRAALMRGAKFFANNCMVCHSMKYLQYNKIAQKAGITLDKMPLQNQKWWLGITPPDLTLVAARRGADWLYTYLHSFYVDPGRPTGYNNLLMPNVNMTNVFATMQGQQVLVESLPSLIEQIGWHKPHYYSVLKLVKMGGMTPEQFDQSIRDLVNFLVYASEPAKVEREQLGWWVIGFLIILLVLSYLLYKMYWENIK